MGYVSGAFSDSEEEESEEEEDSGSDYEASPKKKSASAKKKPAPKKATPARSARKPARKAANKSESEDEESEEVLISLPSRRNNLQICTSLFCLTKMSLMPFDIFTFSWSFCVTSCLTCFGKLFFAL